jgi:hypothetical protein
MWAGAGAPLRQPNLRIPYSQSHFININTRILLAGRLLSCWHAVCSGLVSLHVALGGHVSAEAAGVFRSLFLVCFLFECKSGCGTLLGGALGGLLSLRAAGALRVPPHVLLTTYKPTRPT